MPSPLVTIITPSFNHARFIEATLSSVAAQDYPALEHIVIDGGSTDGTLDLLRAWGGDWISEADDGQADAITKGLARSHGEIVTWLNSDDVYLDPQAVSAAVELLERGAEVVTGGGWYLNADGSRRRRYPVRPTRLSQRAIATADYVLQPATLYRRWLAEQLPLDTSLRYAFDWDLFIRMSRLATFVPLHREIAGYRLQDAGKTVSGGTERQRELLRVVERYHGRRSFLYWRTAPLVAGWRAADHLPGALRRPVQRALWTWPRALNVLTDGRGGPG